MMRRIGISQQFYDVFQDGCVEYRMILPAPIICGALLDPALPTNFPVDVEHSSWIFREDNFDPTTRIRRGRFYKKADMLQPSKERVRLHQRAEDYQRLRTSESLFVFDQYQLTSNVQLPKFAALGSSESLWQVVMRPERISTGEFLFTLKGRHGFGIFPEIDTNSIPERGREKVNETLSALQEAAHREAPGSVIDRARDAAQWCLATWAVAESGDDGLLTDDLGALVKRVARTKKKMAATAAEIVQRLHSRGKPNEQERHGFRPPVEDDAELAVKSMAFIVREIGWAKE